MSFYLFYIITFTTHIIFHSSFYNTLYKSNIFFTDNTHTHTHIGRERERDIHKLQSCHNYFYYSQSENQAIAAGFL